MSDAEKTSGLEAARARLEAALSGLAQRAASARDTLDAAALEAGEKVMLIERIATLEKENLQLHEQVAALALQPETSASNFELDSLREEKAAAEQNHQMLKQQFATLQEKAEREKATIRADLDKAIAELETMLEEA